MFGALAEFERSLIRERTQAGLAAARRAGRTGGRPPKHDIEAAKAMLANPDIGVTQIAHRLGVSPATLYRYIPAAQTANTGRSPKTRRLRMVRGVSVECRHGGKPTFAGACADGEVAPIPAVQRQSGKFVWYARRMDITAAALG
jgi:Helix-turn-helix domain of resolvase/Resolvase, N terminal domain